MDGDNDPAQLRKMLYEIGVNETLAGWLAENKDPAVIRAWTAYARDHAGFDLVSVVESIKYDVKPDVDGDA